MKFVPRTKCTKEGCLEDAVLSYQPHINPDQIDPSRKEQLLAFRVDACLKHLQELYDSGLFDTDPEWVILGLKDVGVRVKE